MKTITYLFPMLLLLSACGSLRDTTAYSDDVYDVPDRQAMAAKAAAEQPAQAQDSSDDYYNPSESRNSNSADRDYYDMTYNDRTTTTMAASASGRASVAMGRAMGWV